MRAFSFFGPKLTADRSIFSKSSDARDCGTRDADTGHHGHDFFASLEKFSSHGHGTEGSVKSAWAGKSCGRGDRDARDYHHDHKDDDHHEASSDFFGKGCGGKTRDRDEADHHGDAHHGGCATDIPVAELPAEDICEEDTTTEVTADAPVEEPATGDDFVVVDLPVCDLPADLPAEDHVSDPVKVMPEQAAADPFADTEEGDTIAGLPLIDLPEQANDHADDNTDAEWSDWADDQFGF